MKTEHHRFVVRHSSPPTIEVDLEAQAVYVRFKKAKVAKTVPRDSRGMHITVDLDARGDVVGIEVVGLTNVNLHTILEKAAVDGPADLGFYSKARYMPVERAA